MDRNVRSDMVKIAVERLTQIIVEEIGVPVDRKTRNIISEAFARIFDTKPIDPAIFWASAATALAVLIRDARSRISPAFMAKVQQRIELDSLLTEYLSRFWNLPDDDTEPGDN